MSVAAADARSATIAVTLVSRPGGPGGETRTFLAVTEDNLVTSVARGENAGHVLRHIGVVRTLREIGPLSLGRPANTTLAIDPAWKRDALHFVAFVQGLDRRIVAAAQTSLRP